MGACNSKQSTASNETNDNKLALSSTNKNGGKDGISKAGEAGVSVHTVAFNETANNSSKDTAIGLNDVRPVVNFTASAEEHEARKLEAASIEASKNSKKVKSAVGGEEVCVPQRTVEERYTVGKELGRGCFGVVRVCTEKESGTRWALKCIQKTSLKSHTIVEDEVVQLKKVGTHPNVVKLHDFFEDFDGNFYIVMELCSGGDLFTRIVNHGSYSEDMAAKLLRQLASAIKHMHNNQVTHRDLKPENILLIDKSKNAPLKVVDFGLSKFVHSPQGMMNTVIGTWAYCAPEVFSRKPYSDSVDNWALGVLAFICLSGYHPFDLYGDSSEAQLIENICAGKYNFNEPEWEDVSDDAKSVITALLQVDPSQRMSIKDFLNTSWISDGKASYATLNRSQKRLKTNISNVFNIVPTAAETVKRPMIIEENELIKEEIE